MLAPFTNLPPDVVAMANATIDKIKSGAFHPFTGPITKQDGSVGVPAGKTISDGDLLGLNWYVKGIDDKLPQLATRATCSSFAGAPQSGAPALASPEATSARMPVLESLTPFLLDWLNLLVRWGHVAVGIGWIGTSFYFIALDLGLRKRPAGEGVLGTAWEVHGGGFYRVDKYAVAPPELPPDLIWFRWEAYLTWITGFALLILTYYLRADVYLVQPSVLDLKPNQAIVISLATLAIGLFAYDRLCKSDLRLHPPSLAGAVYVLILMAALTFGRTFSGRGALIHVGTLIGTIMAYNVFCGDHPEPEEDRRRPHRRPAARPGARRRRQAALGPQQLPDPAGAGADGQQPLSAAHASPAATPGWWSG